MLEKGDYSNVPEEYKFIYTCVKEDRQQSKKDRRLRERIEKFNTLLPQVRYPEIFSMEDVESPDPIMYNKCKAVFGSVAVPNYWKTEVKSIFPKNYVKKKYKIPANILGTGIVELRGQIEEMTLKNKAREKLFPKLGTSAVDPQKLYDCFFKHGYKPKLTVPGDIFYPTWEHFKSTCVPGVMSDELMDALGINELTPPSYLFNMQKLGMPPSYGHLKLPGLNAPIPKGCVYGFEPGSWGEPLYSSYITEVEEVLEQANKVERKNNRYNTPVYKQVDGERLNLSFVPEITRVEDKLPEGQKQESIKHNEEAIRLSDTCNKPVNKRLSIEKKMYKIRLPLQAKPVCLDAGYNRNDTRVLSEVADFKPEKDKEPHLEEIENELEAKSLLDRNFVSENIKKGKSKSKTQKFVKKFKF